MKSNYNISSLDGQLVAPFVGAGIEITGRPLENPHPVVAPFVGAGIEISKVSLCIACYGVAPFVGAGIEIQH